MYAHWVGVVTFSSGGAEGGVILPGASWTPTRTLVILEMCECWGSGKVIIPLRGRAHGKDRVSTARTTLKSIVT